MKGYKEYDKNDNIDVQVRMFKLAMTNLEPVINDKCRATYHAMLQVMLSAQSVVNALAEADKINPI